jgi:hypothetical protein
MSESRTYFSSPEANPQLAVESFDKHYPMMEKNMEDLISRISDEAHHENYGKLIFTASRGA